ncbi:MAG: hypothetical protein VKJ06_00905 [Vampirovibrionales bacterium]|nr:hypothetical protein [Vampirovibrionales bacterium]
MAYKKTRYIALMSLLVGLTGLWAANETLAASAPEHAKQRAEQIREALHSANKNYYGINATSESAMSDTTYDALEAELLELENNNPILKSTNQVVQNKLNTNKITGVQHNWPMLSLDKVHNLDALEAWIASISNKTGKKTLGYSVEPKWDGLAVAAVYHRGKLASVATRGDGKTGENALGRTGLALPKTLKITETPWPEWLTVQGEIVLPGTVFEAINQKRLIAKQTLLANPRNTAVGALRNQNAHDPAKAHLQFIAYRGLLGKSPNESFDKQNTSHLAMLDSLEQWGFKASPERKACTDLTCIKQYIGDWNVKRSTYPIATDGVVIKVDDWALQNALGATAKFPRWAVAYKYPPVSTSVVIRAIECSVSATGKRTPVALFDSVMLEGARIERASLHSDAHLKLLDVRVGDTVRVHRAGSIIPQIINVEQSLRPAISHPFTGCTPN